MGILAIEVCLYMWVYSIENISHKKNTYSNNVECKNVYIYAQENNDFLLDIVVPLAKIVQ